MSSSIFSNNGTRGNVSGIDYSSISNMEQLHAAKLQLGRLIEIKERELTQDTQAVKEALNPITYINRFIAKLYSMEYLLKYAVRGYEYVRDFFNKQPDSSSSANSSEEPAVESPSGVQENDVQQSVGLQ